MNTKSTVLEILSNFSQSQQAVSGQEIALKCGVSRAAVWKAITALRAEGFEIEGTTKGGYKLLATSDAFSKEAFVHFFKNAFPEFLSQNFPLPHIECFKEIDSTNTYAKRCLSECGFLRNSNGSLTEAGKKFHNAVFLAESQTAGRGRSGRTFVSPSKTGIYITVVYAPKGGITEPAKITAFSAVAVCRAIQKLYNIKPSVKWINDIFYQGKKISGILTEGTANFETGIIEAAVIGIGINIQENPQAFGKELSKIAGSILSSKNTNVSRAELAAHVAGNVISILQEEASKVMEEYKALSFIIGKEVEVHSLIDSSEGIYTAKAVDIDQNAGLVVLLPDGRKKTLISGEVSLNSDFFTQNK